MSRTPTQIEDQQEREGKPYIRTCVKAYWRQFAMKKQFLHEHPREAAGWNMPEVRALEADSRVYKVTGPMCRFGMKAHDDTGIPGFVRKETTYLPSSLELEKILEGTCDNCGRQGSTPPCASHRRWESSPCCSLSSADGCRDS